MANFGAPHSLITFDRLRISELTFSDRLVARGDQPAVVINVDCYRGLNTRQSPSMIATLGRARRSVAIPHSIAPSLSTGLTLDSNSSSGYSRDDEVLVRDGLLDDEGTVLPRRIQCEMWWKPCNRLFDLNNLEQWHDHVQSHLGRSEPPKTVSCPFRHCEWTEKSTDSGREAWQSRRDHIDEEHFLDASVEEVWKEKLDSALLEHLWNNRMLTDGQRQTLVRNGCVAVSLPPSSSRHGRNPDNRREGRAPRSGRRQAV